MLEPVDLYITFTTPFRYVHDCDRCRDKWFSTIYVLNVDLEQTREGGRNCRVDGQELVHLNGGVTFPLQVGDP